MADTRFPGSRVRHGTPSGFSRHYDAGEEPCEACCSAKAEYDKKWRSSSDQTKKNRLRAKAQALALAALRRRHPAEYDALYDEKVLEVFDAAGVEPPKGRGRGRA